MSSSVPLSPSAAIVLYVEDDDASALLFRMMLHQLQPATTIFIVESCKKALDFLHCYTPFEKAPLPHLVVLDIHFPDGTGLEILEIIRRHEQLAELPVVFFSTSRLAAHRQRSLELGALGFFQKPVDVDEFEQAVQSIHALIPRTA